MPWDNSRDVRDLLPPPEGKGCPRGGEIVDYPIGLCSCGECPMPAPYSRAAKLAARDDAPGGRRDE